MASRSTGISGVATLAATAGGLLVYTGIKNVSVADGLRSVLRGTLPKGKPPTHAQLPAELKFTQVGVAAGIGIGGSTLGARIAADAKRYLGVPYKWGGATPAGWDCSGFVTWVLAHDLGLHLPSPTHTTAIQFLRWSGATTVPRAQTQPGDLCCWVSHVGIAVNGTSMADAPTAGIPTRIQPIYGGVTIRRVNG